MSPEAPLAEPVAWSAAPLAEPAAWSAAPLAWPKKSGSWLRSGAAFWAYITRHSQASVHWRPACSESLLVAWSKL